MSTVKEDIRHAIDVINSDDNSVNRFDKIYPFATENIYGCFSSYDFQDKDCLTVLGSSAQMLYMYTNGAKNVTTFDINKFSVYYFYLIKAFLLSNLAKEDLVNIFKMKDEKDVKKIFSKVAKYLKGDAYVFWKTLYNIYKEKLFNKEILFHYVDTPTIYYTNGILDSENWNILKKIITNIEPNFMHCNIKDLPNSLNNQYDLMYLSNIIEYTDSIYIEKNKVDSLIKYKELLMKIKEYLKSDGLLYAGYIYEPNNYYVDEPLYNKDRNKIFSKEEFIYHTFKGYNDIEYEVKTQEKRNETDACLIYKKKI